MIWRQPARALHDPDRAGPSAGAGRHVGDVALARPPGARTQEVLYLVEYELTNLRPYHELVDDCHDEGTC